MYNTEHKKYPGPWQDCYCDGTGEPDPEYCTWLWKVDRAIRQMIGMTKADLPDYQYWSEYSVGCDPEDTARRSIRKAAGDMGLPCPID